MGDKKRIWNRMHEGKMGRTYSCDDSVENPEPPIQSTSSKPSVQSTSNEPTGDKKRNWSTMHEGKIARTYNFDDIDEDPKPPIQSTSNESPIQSTSTGSDNESTSSGSENAVSTVRRDWRQMPDDHMRTLAKRFGLNPGNVKKQELIGKISDFAEKNTTEKYGRSIFDTSGFNNRKKTAYTMAQHLDCWDGSDFNFPGPATKQTKIGCPPSNGGACGGSAVHVADPLPRMFLFDFEVPGWKPTQEQPKELMWGPAWMEEHRNIMNASYLQKWKDGEDPFAPSFDEAPTEGPFSECKHCGVVKYLCICDASSLANPPAPPPKQWDEDWPRQFVYPDEKFGWTTSIVDPLIKSEREKNRVDKNLELFEAWYVKHHQGNPS